MAAFSYKAMNAKGKNVSGVLEGDNPRQIRQQLREKGLVPLEVDQVAEKASKGTSKFTLFQPRISTSDLALLTRQLATLIESALPIEEALLAVAEQSDKPRHKNMMMAVRSKVVEGHGLADALSEFPSVFDTLYRAMVAAGEKSGHLDTVLNRLADYTERRQQVKSQIVQAMIYPIMMLVVAVGIVSLLLAYVVPKIIGQFDNMGQELPTVTQILIGMSDATRDYGLYALVVMGLLMVGYQRLLQKASFRLASDRRRLKMPVMGNVVKGLNTSRFASTLSI